MDMLIPKKKWLTPHQLRKLQAYSPQKDRSRWIEKCHEVWSKIVRIRDGHRCQWCGSMKDPQAHHIVARSICSTMAALDLRNGMTMCYRCHIHRLKADPDSYIQFRDSWLKGRGDSYEVLRCLFSVRGKVSLGDLRILYHDLERQLNEVDH